MRVAMTGGSGLLGTALTGALRARGDEVVHARRSAPAELIWSVEGFEPPDALSGFDAVIHLAGESIGGGRWNEARKKAIRDSRIEGTRAVVSALSAASPRPSVLLCASAVGYFGDSGDEVMRDDSPPGNTFLADVVREWEKEARSAEDLGLRVVMPRFGLVLSPEGGVLGQMLPPFRMGVGGRLGSGEHWMSWIHIDDVVRALLFLLDGDLRGPVNCMAPAPVRNTEFTRLLARQIRRPAVFPVPRFALKIVLGELADSVLESVRAVPDRLLAAGFTFDHPDLAEALRDLLPNGRD